MNQLEVSNVPIWPIYHLARRVEGKKAAFAASQCAQCSKQRRVSTDKYRVDEAGGGGGG